MRFHPFLETVMKKKKKGLSRTHKTNKSIARDAATSLLSLD